MFVLKKVVDEIKWFIFKDILNEVFLFKMFSICNIFVGLDD